VSVKFIGHNLYPLEQQKLERLDEKLAAAFVAAGCPDVRLCAAVGEGENRKITFLRHPGGPPLISFTALAFLASTGAELAEMIAGHFGGDSRTV
jgi:hypothetical protein